MPLIINLGCFPLDLEPYRPKTDSKNLKIKIIQSLEGPKAAKSALTKLIKFFRQYLNIFRREPAITKYDWPFTSLSQIISGYCNNHEFIPPYFLDISNCSKQDHLASGTFLLDLTPY